MSWRTVRCFGQGIDPAVYRRGFGFLGWLAYVLNIVRAWLEQQVVLLVLVVDVGRVHQKCEHDRIDDGGPQEPPESERGFVFTHEIAVDRPAPLDNHTLSDYSGSITTAREARYASRRLRLQERDEGDGS
jgi:hypothetical protein